jgi:hypothetical protein
MSHTCRKVFMVLALMGITVGIALIHNSASAQPAGKSAGLPAELQGVWTIVSGEEDGKPMRFARGDDVEIGDSVHNEIIVQGDRWIVVDHSGGALVFRAKVEATQPEKRIRIWGDRGQTEREGPRTVFYRVRGDQLENGAIAAADLDHVHAAVGSGCILARGRCSRNLGAEVLHRGCPTSRGSLPSRPSPTCKKVFPPKLTISQDFSALT